MNVSAEPTRVEPRGTTLLRLALGLLLLIFVVKLAYWGLGRVGTPGGSGDFKTLYAASRAWAAGENPYDYATLDRTLVRSGAGPVADGFWAATPSLYPPTAFVAMWPATRLAWPQDRWAWAGVNVACVAGLLWTLIRWTGRPATGWPVLLMATLTLGLRPIHTGIALGQPAIATVMLVVAGLYLAHRVGRPTLAGALLGLACCIKPQLAGPFVVAAALLAGWRVIVAAAAVYAAAWAIALGYSAAHGVSLLGPWRALLVASVGPGSVNDPSPANEFRYQLINLQVPLAALIHNLSLVNALAAGTVGPAMAAGLLVLWRRRGEPARVPLALAALAALTLLPVYHRVYDGLILVIALAWAATVLGRRAPRVETVAAWVACACVLAFVAPMQVVLVFAQRLMPAVVDRPWWNALGVAHMAIAVLLLAVVLLTTLLLGRTARVPETRPGI